MFIRFNLTVIRELLLLLLLPVSAWAAAPMAVEQRPPGFKVEPPLPEEVEKALLIAEQFEQEGSYDAARRQLVAVLPNLPLRRVASLWIRICYLWERDDAALQARDCYLDLGKRLKPVDSESAALSNYRAAVILSREDDSLTVLDELVAIVLGAPGAVGAQRSMALARQLQREMGGPAAEAVFLRDLSLQIWSQHLQREGLTGEKYVRRLVASGMVAAGKLYLNQLRNPQIAFSLFEKAAQVGQDTVWWDDALLWQARSAVASQLFSKGLKLYKELMDSMESSWFVGSYNSEFMDEAFFEYAKTLKKTKRIEDARQAFRKLIEELPESRLKDDAAYELALLVPKFEQTRALQEFIKTYPHSRHVKSAKRALKL